MRIIYHIANEEEDGRMRSKKTERENIFIKTSLIKHLSSFLNLSLAIINKNYLQNRFLLSFSFLFLYYLLELFYFYYLPIMFLRIHFYTFRVNGSISCDPSRSISWMFSHYIGSMRVSESTTYEKHVPWIRNANLPSLLFYKDPFRSFLSAKSIFFFFNCI